MRRLLQASAEEFAAGSVTTASTRAEPIQTKLTVNKPGDEYEQEADHVAEQVMRMPEPRIQRDCACGSGCSKCQTNQPGSQNQRLQTKRIDSVDSESTAVPPAVDEVLSSAGQPLDTSTRTFMERRFNNDFRQVRVHTDSKAAESARDLNANAYTVGTNIVFGAGQFLPGTQVGRRLLSHELTHVLQQRSSPVPAARSIAGPTCPSLQRETPQGAPAGSAQPRTAPVPQPQPLDYDRDPKNVAPVPAGQSAAGVRSLLNDKVKRGEITRFSLIGVQPGSRAEIFMLSLLYGMADRARWGRESDILTAIDWPAKQGDLAPQGQVTVRIDHQGAASAELIAAGPVPAVAQATAAAATSQLTTDFGFRSVTGWSGQNAAKDAAEMSDVVAALQLLKTRAPQDVAALKGVELMRVPTLGNQRAGEFYAGSNVALGAAADVKPWLKLANLAFDSNSVQFYGGGAGSPSLPASFQVILHEVGHAVETEQLRLAREAYVKASDEAEAARKLLVEDPAVFEAERKAAVSKGKKAENEFYKNKKASYDKNVKAQQEASARQTEEGTKLDSTRVAGSGITRRLQKFIDLVNANNIRRFTRYSVINWPNSPEEFYAEAYSLWLVDPNFLKTNYRVVYDFFQNGDYRN